MKKLLFATVLMLVTASIILTGCRNGNGKIPDPGGSFTYDRVIVMLTVEASALGKTWAPLDFPEFAFSKIEQIGISTPKVFAFHLEEHSRNNVLRAIYLLRTRSEVYSAGPNWIVTPGL